MWCTASSSSSSSSLLLSPADFVGGILKTCCVCASMCAHCGLIAQYQCNKLTNVLQNSIVGASLEFVSDKFEYQWPWPILTYFSRSKSLFYNKQHTSCTTVPINFKMVHLVHVWNVLDKFKVINLHLFLHTFPDKKVTGRIVFHNSLIIHGIIHQISVWIVCFIFFVPCQDFIEGPQFEFDLDTLSTFVNITNCFDYFMLLEQCNVRQIKVYNKFYRDLCVTFLNFVTFLTKIKLLLLLL